jgi:hypothetical protein
VTTPIAAPTTRSPGKVAIDYRYGGVTHQVSVNLINGVDINDISTLQIDADHLADQLEPVLPAPATWSGWRLLSPSGQTLYRAALSSVHVGTHGTNPSMPAYFSPTLKIMGRGAPTSVLAGSGMTYVELFVRSGYTFNPGDHVLGYSDAALDSFIADLRTYLRYFADFYGQHADPTGDIFVQFNAHEQERTGL